MTENIKCYICSESATQDNFIEGISILCTRCGEYCMKERFPKSFIGQLDEQQIANISHWIKTSQNLDEPVIIESANLDYLKNIKTLKCV